MAFSRRKQRPLALLARGGVAVLCGWVFCVPVSAQDKYPGKVIRVLTSSPGSNHDWGARIVAQELTPRIGQRVIVENRGAISSEIVAKESPPDGYTLQIGRAHV